MIKFCRSLIAFVLLSTLFTVVSTQTSNAGIETLKYCAVNFNRDIPLTETAFTYEIKYALGYDEELASYTSGSNPDFPNAAGGVVTSDHSTLLGSRDASNAGLEIYYNTTYLDGQLLFYMGKPGGWHWFKNPSWKFPEFTRAQGSSPYIHIAVVRDAQRRLALYFNGVPATQSGTTTIQGAVTYNDVSYQVDNNVYSSVRYFGTSGSYTAEINPKAFVSNLRLVTGAALYSATAASISIPSTAALKLNADTGTTQVILNSRTPEGLLTNESNYDATAASLYNFGGDQTAINNQIAVGAACTPTPEDAYIGGDGVYNVYYKEGNVLKDYGTAPKKRDFYFSENVNPTPITIPTNGSMVKASNEFVGWNTQTNGLGQTYRAGSSYRPTDNTTLYTKWSTRKTITYNYNGGTGTLPTESNKLWEDTFTVAANTATNGVLIFNGWRDGSNVIYGPGSTYTVPNNDVTLTAVWSGDTTISTADINMAAPDANDIPVTSLVSNGEYTTAISWNTTPFTFDYNTIYTATVTVTPVAGYTLTGVNANFFTVNGNPATTPNSLNAGSFTYQFPRTALGPALTPSFDTPTATADGYSVTITNYDAAYTWDTPTVSSGSVAITSTSTPNRVLTVTGLSPGDSATITQTTSRVNYSSGSNTVSGTTLPPLNPTFGSVTRNNGGFSVPITNYDSEYTWDTPTVTSGSVAVTGTGQWSTNSNSSGIYEWRSIASSSDGTKLAAVSYNGYIYTSTNSGSTWTSQTNAGLGNWFSIASSSDGTKLAAVVKNGSIWTSINSGVTWTERSTGANRNWYSIASSSDGTKLAAAVDGGLIWTSADSGSTWTAQTNAGSRGWLSIASSSDGTKLAAVHNGRGIWTSTDSGATWTAQTSAGSRAWYSIASSSDGTKLAAVAYSGYIYTSTDSGATWTAQTSAGSRDWFSIASSSDGTKLAAVAYDDHIYTSTDSGVTWTDQIIAGSQYLYSIASSSDGTKLVTATFNRYIYTLAPRALTVTGLSDGETATITQGTSRTNYPNGTNSVTGTAQVPLNPTFGSVTRTATGFTVSITNYDANYTWDTPTVTTGTVAITSTDGANRLLTVTGLSPADSATITQATSRSNYPNGTNTVAGTALNAAYNPTFDTPTATGVGFSVSITNYDASYTWDTPTVSRGSVAVTSTIGAIRVLTVSGLSPGDTATITQTTSRSTYAPGSNTVTSRTLLVINEANVAITAPITGATPVSSLVSNGQYTTAITWSDTPTTFAPNTFYTATVTVTPDSGYMLSGVGANFFTVNGNSATSGNLANAGVFTYQFPETAIIVTTANISITAPATGATPVTSLASNGQYTTAITWSDSPTRFAATTAYTATVTVVPNAGYTLTGVAANLFTVNGDTATGTGSYSKTTLNSGGIPYGIAVDSAGNVYTPNIGSNTVTKTTPQGVSSTLGTTGEVRELDMVPMGIAVDSLGNVYVSNVVSSTVTKITPQGVSTTFGTTGASPVGIAVDSLGNVYTADADSSTVTKITPQGVSTTLGTTASTPIGIAVDSSGNVYTSHYFSDSDSFTVTKITPQGVSTTLGTTDGAAFAIAVDSLGNVYTANYTVGTVTKITPQGVSTTFGNTGSNPLGIAVDSLGNVYVSSVDLTGAETGTVTKITPQGVSTTLGTTGSLPIGIAVDSSGNVYTANAFSGNVTKFTASGTNAANAGTFIYRFAATGAKLAQAITFSQPADMSMTSDTQTLSATSSATGSYPVTFTSLTTGICTITNGAISVVAAGICSIRATQAGDGIYSAATGVIKSIAITSNKLTQSITFAQPAAMNTRSSSQALTATSSAGASYTVTLTSNTPLICTISSRAIVVVKSGTCSITASQAGNGSYQAATSVTRTVVISKVSQTITFSQPAAMTVSSGNQPLNATSSATGSYPVSFTSTTTGICAIDGGAISVVASGTCSITASQAGDDTYTAAASVTKSLVISKGTQAITFPQPNAMTMASSNQLLTATSNAGGSYPVSYSANTAICTIVASGADRYVHVVAPGTCSITATQAGDTTYAPATSVVRTFTIAKLAQTITFTTPAAMTVASGDQTLSASSSAGGSYAVKFTSTTPAVCRIINGNTLQAVSAGTCSITASQAGNATYAAANNVVKSFVLASARRK